MDVIKKDDRLYSLLEKIIFNENEFKLLKTTINEVSEGKIQPKSLRNLIIQDRIRILEDLVEFFPFYIQYSVQQFNKSIERNSYQTDEILNQKIKEREKLLEIIAKRLNDLVNKSSQE